MKLIVDHAWTWIEGEHPSNIILPVLSYKVEGAWFSSAYKAGHWDGREKFIEYDRSRKQYRFPSGLVSRVTTALDAANYRYSLIDERSYDPPDPCFLLLDDYGNPTIDLTKGKWSYQSRMVVDALSRGRGIISVPTGGGKTELGAALIASLKKKTVWLTHRVNLMYQAQERLEKRLGIPIGMVGDGHWNIQDVTVVMAQTAITSLQEGREDLDHFLRTCEVFIPDEAHHAESDQWYEILGRVNAPWRFGLTATPQLEGPGLALVGMVGEIVAQVSLLELIERRVLVLPRIWFISTNVPKLKGVRDARVAYKQGVVMCKERNEAICRVAEVFKMENKPCVTLVKRVAHGELLSNMMCQRGIRAEYLYGNTPKEERKGLLEKLADGRYSNIVATAELLGEGTDLPWLRAIINATGTKGGGDKANGETGRNTLQFLGRVIRSHPGKFYADYVDIVDNCHKSLLDNTRARVSTLQSEGYGPFIKYWRDYKVEI